MEQENKDIASIYVGNVPWKATGEDIKMLIATSANVEVTDVRIIKEKGSGRSRGFAFVDIIHRDADEFIQSAPEITIQGRTLYFRDAKPKKEEENVYEPSIEEINKKISQSVI